MIYHPSFVYEWQKFYSVYGDEAAEKFKAWLKYNKLDPELPLEAQVPTKTVKQFEAEHGLTNAGPPDIPNLTKVKIPKPKDMNLPDMQMLGEASDESSTTIELWKKKGLPTVFGKITAEDYRMAIVATEQDMRAAHTSAPKQDQIEEFNKTHRVDKEVKTNE